MDDRSLLLAATFLYGAMPGPCAILAASRAVRGGVRSGLWVSTGVILGLTALISVALLVIVGAIVVSTSLLALLRWAGVAALLLLALHVMMASGAGGLVLPISVVSAGDLVAGVLVVVFSPMVLIFLLALLPQFVAASGSELGPALTAAGLFLAGAAAAQVGATIFGTCSARLAGRRARWIEYLCAVSLVAFAVAAVINPLNG